VLVIGAVGAVLLVVIAATAMAITNVGTEATCKFQVQKFDKTYSAAVDGILPNCWLVQAKNVSAETFHTYWWYYPNYTHIDPTPGETYSYASKVSNVTVANYGRAQYCTEDDPNTNDCDGLATYWTQWYWGW